MSRMLWVWFLCFFESVYRQVAFERPLLAAPQSYLCGQGLPLVSLGKTPTTLVRLFTALKSRPSMFVERIRAWWLPG